MARTINFNTVFSYAFRPLFALLALHGLLIVPYWALAWSGRLPLPSITANPLLWHGHEMLFGFAGVAIAGFLLTAVANWTKRPPVSGWRLLLLSALWLLARIAWCMPNAAALPIAAIFDLGFNFLLLILFTCELIAADNRRNFKVAAVLFLYTAINAGMYFALLTGNTEPRRWLWAAMYLVILLINIIGGRVIPLFTGNWLRQHFPNDTVPATAVSATTVPTTFARFDFIAVALTVIFIIAALAALPGAGWLGIIAGLAQALRLLRWHGWRTAREPLLWSLHIAYAWLALGLLLIGTALLGWIPLTSGVHALTVGAIGGLIVAMSSRAALGHTGRALTSHPLLTATFVFINIAALTRVLAPFFSGTALLLCSALAWLIALAAYCLRYLPILLLPATPPQNRA